MNIDYHLERWIRAMKVAVQRLDQLLARLGMRVRLSLSAAALVLVALTAVELVTLAILRTQLYGTVDANVALEVRAFQQQVSYAATATDVDLTAREFITSDPAAASGLAPVIRVQLAGGATITNTKDSALLLMVGRSATSGEISTVTGPRGDYRMAAAKISLGRKSIGDVRVALPLHEAQVILATLTPVMSLLCLGIAAASGLLTYGVVSRALVPVARIRLAAAGITERDFGHRIEHRGPRDEVGQLAATFDDMVTRLEHGFRQREKVYALASHELRTPLTVIRGHLQVLRRQKKPSLAEVQQTIDVALQELERVTEDVNDMLFLSRMQGDKVSTKSVDIRELLLEVHRRARGASPQHWVVHAPKAVVVQGNREQLARALLNLIVNAARHTPESGEINLSCQSSGGHALITVADSGNGIAPEHLPHVFEPWFKDGRSRSDGGLGLTVVYEIARTHGGAVHVESKPGAGARFTIELPLA
jgi:two-component system, OmpR family, sensor kinase